MPLGVLPKNENKMTDMVDIMSHLHQYVPVVESPEPLLASEDSSQVHGVLFGGDQLTVARARGAKKIMSNALTRAKRIEGIVPVAEDWHTKMNFLDVCV